MRVLDFPRFGAPPSFDAHYWQVFYTIPYETDVKNSCAIVEYKSGSRYATCHFCLFVFVLLRENKKLIDSQTSLTLVSYQTYVEIFLKVTLICLFN